jgi:hypothetical protein
MHTTTATIIYEHQESTTLTEEKLPRVKVSISKTTTGPSAMLSEEAHTWPMKIPNVPQSIALQRHPGLAVCRNTSN